MPFPGEKVFKSARELKYLFQQPQVKSDYLLVVFSGFSPIGQSPLYCYINALADINCNKLFILDDYGPRGSYYLGCNRDLSIEASVISLITHLARQNSIPFQNVISIGSSKGGFAALYFGIKYGFGHVISGAPQTLIGHYLIDLGTSKEVASYISGGVTENDSEYLNSLWLNVIKEVSVFPDIYLHVGKGDYHYNCYVKPFAEFLDTKEIRYCLDIGDYSEHKEVGHFFTKFLLTTLGEIISNNKIK